MTTTIMLVPGGFAIASWVECCQVREVRARRRIFPAEEHHIEQYCANSIVVEQAQTLLEGNTK